MVEEIVQPRFICETCMESYEMRDAAEKCETISFSPKYREKDIVRVSGGSRVYQDYLQDTNFFVHSVFPEKKTHEPRYVVVELPDEAKLNAVNAIKENAIKNRARIDEVIAKTKAAGRKTVFLERLAEDARHANDEEFLLRFVSVHTLKEGEIYVPQVLVDSKPVIEGKM